MGTTTNQQATPDVRAPLRVVVDVQPRDQGNPSMAINEYRRYAAECVLIADGMTSPGHKVSLLSMAQAWLKLARRAEDDAPLTEASASVRALSRAAGVSGTEPTNVITGRYD